VIPFSLQHLKTLIAISPLLQHKSLLIGFGVLNGAIKRGSMVAADVYLCIFMYF